MSHVGLNSIPKLFALSLLIELANVLERAENELDLMCCWRILYYCLK